MNDLGLVAIIERLSRGEIEATLELLLYLGEFDWRQAYRGLGYSSLHEYCVRHLRYADSAATRRIMACRCMREFPVVVDMLRNREVSLSTICLFKGLLNEENASDIFEAVRGKSLEQVRQYCNSYSPKKSVPKEVIRVVHVQPVPQTVVESAPLLSVPVVVGPIEPVQKVIQISFTVTEEEYAEVCRLQQVRSGSGRVPKAKDLFITGVRDGLRREDPRQREERRIKRAEKVKESPPPAEVDMRDEPSNVVTRHVPVETADRVLNESGHWCTFTANGVRCTNTIGVQIDHIRPFGKGGGHDQGNLRALCRVHNQFVAEQAYGKDVMDRYRLRQGEFDRQPQVFRE